MLCPQTVRAELQRAGDGGRVLVLNLVKTLLEAQEGATDEPNMGGAVISANTLAIRNSGKVIAEQLANRSFAAEASLDVARIENPFDAGVGYYSPQVTLPGSKSPLRWSPGFERSTPLGLDNINKIITNRQWFLP